MTRHAIVVGANYGDEGKGLIADYLAETLDAKYVARFNGGAQAGHTVHRDGKRHVFSSFGAGTLTGRQTILTKDVIVNPFAALKEAEMLRDMGEHPLPLLISRSSPVTTQFDMLVNQMSERMRDDGRHGSCGLGIHETIVRHLAAQRMSKAGSLFDPDDKLLSWIGKDYFPSRLIKLNMAMKMKEAEWLALLNSVDEHIEEFKVLMARAKRDGVFSFRHRINGDEPIVYEGAQGLALDEFMGDFPHVTHSNTGIANALDHINQIGGDGVMAVYVTRTFLTKHGAGAMKNEMSVSDVLGRDFADETNITNEWQQSFRYAPLNIADTANRIKADIERNKIRIQDYGLDFKPMIAITFMDQDSILVVKDEKLVKMHVEDIARHLQEAAGIPVKLAAHGREAKHVNVLDM